MAKGGKSPVLRYAKSAGINSDAKGPVVRCRRWGRTRFFSRCRPAESRLAHAGPQGHPGFWGAVLSTRFITASRKIRPTTASFAPLSECRFGVAACTPSAAGAASCRRSPDAILPATCVRGRPALRHPGLRVVDRRYVADVDGVSRRSMPARIRLALAFAEAVERPYPAQAARRASASALIRRIIERRPFARCVDRCSIRPILPKVSSASSLAISEACLPE